MKSLSQENRVILGVDLGSNSIGWALFDEISGDVKAAGVRVFDAGVEGEKKEIESGREESRAKKRREARQIRRQTWRRAQRLRKLYNILQEKGLLPKGSVDEVIPKIDLSLYQRYAPHLSNAHILPYYLRAKALDEKLEPFELGRALYHLAQRRGFKDNRRINTSEDEEENRKEIIELEQKIQETGARTLGEYFSKLDPEKERIRNRRISRKMYEDEFNKIWEKQKNFHPDLTDELKDRIHDAIFHQRPLKSQKHLIGECELEPGQKRALKALLICQKFRFLQKINDTTVLEPGRTPRSFSHEERQKLISELDKKSELTFAQVRKLLKLSNDCRFISADKRKLLGNLTAAKIIEVIGEQKWFSLPEVKRRKMVAYLLHRDTESIKNRVMREFGLDPSTAEKFAQITLEKGYIRLSIAALKKLIPLMEQGSPFETAKRQIPEYNQRPSFTCEPKEFLPPVLDTNEFSAEKSGLTIRNPMVTRALAELRKVVNALIKRYGKPDTIRIELARELKKNKKVRQEITDEIEKREKERKDAKKFLEENKIVPTPTNILKYRLWKECNEECPYTGKKISFESLFGDAPQFDIEHIVPFSRSLDNSFTNKTLCCVEENAKKGNKTPYEAYYGTDKWQEILSRVGKFNSDFKNQKLKLFQKVLDESDDFANSQLRDTAYAATEASKYLAHLYGGIVDSSGKRRIEAVKGQVTSHIRRVLGLNTILGENPESRKEIDEKEAEKSREDHRHHAIDAIAIALATPSMVKKLSEAAKSAGHLPPKARCRYFKHFAPVEPPCENFVEKVHNIIENIKTSYRVSRKVRGPLHEETYYFPRDDKGHKKEVGECVHIRKRLDELTSENIKEIVDKTVRECVEAKLKELGKTSPKEAFKQESNLPRHKNGKIIRKVRIRKNLSVFPVGEGSRKRYVANASNHHMEIVETTDGEWEGYVVTTYEAMQRLKNKEPIIKRDFGEGKKFVFSLACGEIIELDEVDEKRQKILDENGNPKRGLYRIRTVPQSKQIRFVPINDARKITQIRKQGTQGMTAKPESLRERNCQKVIITPLGEVRKAND